MASRFLDRLFATTPSPDAVLLMTAMEEERTGGGQRVSGFSMPQRLRADIGSSIEGELRRVSRHSELRIALARLLSVSLIGVLDWCAYVWPSRIYGIAHFPLSEALLISGWALFALGVAWFLKLGYYRRQLAWLLPTLDGLFLFTAYAHFKLSLPAGVFGRIAMPSIATACGVLALTGGIRLARANAIYTTLLGSAIYLGICWNVLSFGQLAFTTSLYGMVGMFGVWMTDLVREALQGQTGRLVLKRFLPGAVVDRAYQNPLALLGGARRVDATVLISDLRDFTALCETMPHAELLGFLSELQGAFAGAIQAQGGLVDKFMGDGMLAVFGAVGGERQLAGGGAGAAGHALQAVKAALALREALGKINEGRSRADKPIVRMGVGVHSGPLVAGCVGQGERMEFTVLGSTVNLASRIEALTKVHGVDILVSHETVQRLAPNSGLGQVLIPLGETPLRGHGTPIGISRLAGFEPLPRRTRSGIALSRPS